MNNTGVVCTKCGHFIILNYMGQSECLCEENDEIGEHFSAAGDQPNREERERRLYLQDENAWWTARERIGDLSPIDTRVFPTDREIMDDGLQQTYDILRSARRFLKAKYPHITHIAGWIVPED